VKQNANNALTNANSSTATSNLIFGNGTAPKLQLNNFDAAVTSLVSSNVNAIVENGAAGTKTLTVVNGADNTFAGKLQNGSAGVLTLTKSGGGTLTLTGTNTYTGATNINGGTLQVGVSGVGSTSATSAVTVNGSGAALAGTGTVNGNVSVTLGTIRPGDSAGTGVGTLNIGGTLGVGSTGILSHGLSSVGYFDSNFATNYDGSTTALAYLNAASPSLVSNWKYTPGAQNDYIKVTGALTLTSGSTLELTDAGYASTVMKIGDVFNLLDWSGVGTASAGSSTLSLPTPFSNALTLAGLSFDTSAFSTYGVVVVVPEPSRMILLFVGISALFMRRRRS
jgi:autotransporter-associated beta strand protein